VHFATERERGWEGDKGRSFFSTSKTMTSFNSFSISMALPLTSEVRAEI
jgi:hypothetical protein